MSFTSWVNDDSPDMDGLDAEAVRKPCGPLEPPTAIECRTVINQTSSTDLPSNLGVTCDVKKGLRCDRKSNGGFDCPDFEIRYACPAPEKQCVDVEECNGVAMDVCKNNATCVNTGGDYSCLSCPSEYEGFHCQREVNECSSAPCENNSTCTDGLGFYTCGCLPGFTGTVCETNIDECLNNTCVENGTTSCQDGINSFMCVCKDGFVGGNCETEINECDSGPCLFGATCVNEINMYSCMCAEGYTGVHCETIIKSCTDSFCQNGGECLDLYNGTFCSCKPGFSGDRCQNGSQPCDVANPCVNGAVCTNVNGEPVCTPCPDGFTGTGCECLRDYCGERGVCLNGATCSVPSLGQYSCACPTGFTGADCETNIDDGANKDCGQGTTIDGINVAYCDCDFGRAGESCDRAIDRSIDIDFAGSDSVMTRFPLSLSTSALTVSFWVRVDEDGPAVSLLEGRASRGRPSPLLVVTAGGEAQTNDSVVASDSTLITLGGQWHHIALIWRAGMTYVLYKDTARSESPMVTDIMALPMNTNVMLGGGHFRGSVSLVQLWSRELSSTEITEIFNAKNTDVLVSTSWYNLNLTLDWDVGRYTTNQLVTRTLPSTRGQLVCEDGNSAPSGSTATSDCVQSTDKTAPMISSCPGDLAETLVGENRSTNVMWSVTFTGATRDSSNYVSGGEFAAGLYQVAHNGFDSVNNRAQCDFKLAVKAAQGTCEALNPSVGTLSCSLSPSITEPCAVTCLTGLQVLRPAARLVSCGLGGVFNVDEPYLPYRFPACAEVAADGIAKKTLTVTWQYSLSAYSDSIGNTLKDNRIPGSLDDLSTNTQSDPSGTPFCTGSSPNCDNAVITITGSSSTANVSLTITGVALVYDSASVEDIFRQYLQQNKFDYNDLADGVTVMPGTFIISCQTTCPSLYEAVGDQCLKCPPGTFYNSATLTCDDCPKGEYTGSAGLTTCTPCTSGETTVLTGAWQASECILDCPAGQFYSTNQCSNCSKGFYQPDTGTDYCLPCPAGQTTETTGSTASSQCKDGCESGYQLRNEVCEVCPKGQYRTKLLHEVCQPCPGEFTTAQNASTSEADCTVKTCPAGSYSNGTDCLSCPLSTYKPDRSELACTDCPTSYRTDLEGSSLLTDCKFFCPAGQFVSNFTCELCPISTYKIATDYYATQCTDCPNQPGTSTPLKTDGKGATAEADCRFAFCSAGQQLVPSDPSQCEDCPFDQYQPNPDPIYVVDNCTTCATNFGTRQIQTANETQCERFCPDGEELSGSSCTPCARGYYKTNSNQLDRFDMCTLCPEDKITSGIGSNSNSDCSIGNCTAGYKTVGGSCEVCPVGTYQSTKWQTMCEPCPDGSTTSSDTSTAITDCNVYPNSSKVLISVTLQLSFDASYYDSTSSAFISLAAQILISFQTMFTGSGVPTGFRAVFRVVGFSPGSTVVQVEALVDDSDANAATDVQTFVQQSVQGNNNQLGNMSVVMSEAVVAAPVDSASENGCAQGYILMLSGGTYNCTACPLATYQESGRSDASCQDCAYATTTSTTASIGSGSCSVANLNQVLGVRIFFSSQNSPLTVAFDAAIRAKVLEVVRTVSAQSDIYQVSVEPASSVYVIMYITYDGTTAGLQAIFQALTAAAAAGNLEGGSAVNQVTIPLGYECAKAEPCSGSGTCVFSATNTNRFMCQCQSPYEGTTCDIRGEPTGGNLEVIIGGVVGGVCGLILLILLCCCLFRPSRDREPKRKRYREPSLDFGPVGQQYAPGQIYPGTALGYPSYGGIPVAGSTLSGAGYGGVFYSPSANTLASQATQSYPTFDAARQSYLFYDEAEQGRQSLRNQSAMQFYS